MRFMRTTFACLLFLTVLSCTRSTEERFKLDPQRGGTLHPGNQTNSIPDDGEWHRAGKDFANTRYAAIDQIRKENVKDLKLAWTFSTGVPRGQEAAPLVVNGSMYIVTPYPNILYALDLTKPGAPAKWTYK